MNWCHREPTLDEILSEPIIRAVMEADGVDRTSSRRCCGKRAEMHAGKAAGDRRREPSRARALPNEWGGWLFY